MIKIENDSILLANECQKLIIRNENTSMSNMKTVEAEIPYNLLENLDKDQLRKLTTYTEINFLKFNFLSHLTLTDDGLLTNIPPLLIYLSAPRRKLIDYVPRSLLYLDIASTKYSGRGIEFLRIKCLCDTNGLENLMYLICNNYTHRKHLKYVRFIRNDLLEFNADKSFDKSYERKIKEYYNSL